MIKEKYSTSRLPCLRYQGRVVMEHPSLANIIAEYYHSICDNRYDPAFMQIKQQEETQLMDFTMNEYLHYSE